MHAYFKPIKTFRQCMQDNYAVVGLGMTEQLHEKRDYREMQRDSGISSSLSSLKCVFVCLRSARLRCV